MSSSTEVMQLLQSEVPLRLLFDLAGLGPSSEELYRTETSYVPEQTRSYPRPTLVPVAS